MIFALGGFALLYWAIAVGGHWAIARHGRRWLTGPTPAKSYQPPVTLIKALSGTFPALEANLSSFFGQEYPVLEVHLAAQLENDLAVAPARRVASRFKIPFRFFSRGKEPLPIQKSKM